MRPESWPAQLWASGVEGLGFGFSEDLNLGFGGVWVGAWWAGFAVLP